MRNYNEPLLNHPPVRCISSCLDSSETARGVRKQYWSEYLRNVCLEDETKWRNKCASMLRRIRRIKDAMEDGSSRREISGLSPSLRENRMQTAIEDYSIQTGLDYEQSKSVLVVGERGGTPENRLRNFIEAATPPLMDAMTLHADPAFQDDDRLAEERSVFYQLSVWLLSRSKWLVLVSVFVGFFYNASFLSAVPLVATSVIGLSYFPFAPHGLWKWLLAVSVFVLAIKILFQIPSLCDSGSFICLASKFTKQGDPVCPSLYIATNLMRLGLYKVPLTDSAAIQSWISLIWTELFTIASLSLHLRSLYLSGRLESDPYIQAGGSRPSKDLYAIRFLLCLLITTLLITDWNRISASKIPVFSKSLLGEGISRNYFSPWQVVAVTFFVFQIVLDRCVYTLMSYAPNHSVVVRWTRINACIQFGFLVFAMNLRISIPFFCIYAAYLVLTCYQLAFDIRPVGGKSGFLWRPGWFSYYCYRAYLAVPFLDELRQLCDWVATPATSLSLFMWFKVEDCVHNLRFVQAEMDSRQSLPSTRADRTCGGFAAIIGMVAIITGPLVFFSGLNVLREPNPVVSVIPGLGPTSMKIWIGIDHLKILLYSSSQVETIPVNSDSVKTDEVLAPLLVMQSSDLQLIRFPPFSDVEFTLSPPLRAALQSALTSSPKRNATIKAEWSFNRELSSFLTTVNTETFIPARSVLEALTTPKNSSSINVPNLFPSVVYLDSSPSGKIVPEEGLHPETVLTINTDAQGTQWWSWTDPSSSGMLCLGERSMGAGSASYSISVVGLYFGVVLTVGRFLRLSILGSSKRIDVEELPCTETVMHLCQGIHIARIFKDIDTEKRLYYDLVKLFRDPQLLIAATGETTIQR